jgi:hypothetical protein
MTRKYSVLTCLKISVYFDYRLYILKLKSHCSSVLQCGAQFTKQGRTHGGGALGAKAPPKTEQT